MNDAVEQHDDEDVDVIEHCHGRLGGCAVIIYDASVMEVVVHHSISWLLSFMTPYLGCCRSSLHSWLLSWAVY